MKRSVHIVLVALVLQLSGVLGVCAPLTNTASKAEHDCCTPPAQKAPSRETAPIPYCCLVATFHEQGSIGQTKPTSENTTQDLAVAKRTPAPLNFVSRRDASERWLVAHPVSPPVSPLRQTCLLLI